MKMLVYFLLCAAIIAGCASTKKVTEEETVTEKEMTSVENSTVDAFVEGQMLFVQNCGSCHVLHLPTTFSKENWEKILPVMIRKAKLGEPEGDVIHQYIFSEIEKGTQD